MSLPYFSGKSTILHNILGFHNQIGKTLRLAIVILEQNNYYAISIFNTKVLIAISVFYLSKLFNVVKFNQSTELCIYKIENFLNVMKQEDKKINV